MESIITFEKLHQKPTLAGRLNYLVSVKRVKIQKITHEGIILKADENDTKLMTGTVLK